MPHSIPLPANYRADEVLAFHGRDPSQLAERLGEGVLRKGLMFDGKPAMLTIALTEHEARHALDIDGAGDDDTSAVQADAIVRHMLGLHLQPEPFEESVADDALLGAVVRRQRGLRIPQTATAFEALTWAIIGQQIGLGFAITLRRRLIESGGARHSSGLACYPGASEVARMSADALGQLQFSRAKSEALIRVARLVEDGKLDLPSLAMAEPEVVFEVLTAIKGIGPWTANYVLMRGLGAVDCSLHGDAAVRAAIVRITGHAHKLDQAEAQRVLAQYSPWRSLAAAHLWASHLLPA
ncbi:AlkA N-terminal domain-containing protein [Uliginosibacterium sp. H3]|uniref:DNA-3-methyladenine glycosylase II n=1 Tax=Uliginosibacterium silvisoli TaxID=3114758 RepID=A0ABU6K8W6_9RHOO|nr:AlkA N-terminal domain-containing protein [Uliginosibacterium sp. H3]